MKFEPSRTAGLARLADFLPRAGRAYAESRNFDNGAPEDGARQNVSQLSPWLHAGLLGEAEVIEAVVEQHGPKPAEKFVSEVFWRVYFKGYLEQRPSIWSAYRRQRDAALGEIEDNAAMRASYEDALAGRTGIAAFDYWARELVDTGYLHNHARMWFASIWIFTLKLDWTLGADFFLRHLMDGDAASNTLSWRWVGGLHTKGKTYLARRSNISRYTAEMPGGPLEAEGLADEAPALEEDQEHGRQPLDLPSPVLIQDVDRPFALVLHDEAASHVPLDLPEPPKLIIGAARPEARSPLEIGEHARNFARGAVENGVREAGDAFDCPTRRWDADGDLEAILSETELTRIALPNLATGWTRDALLPELQPFTEREDAIILLDDLSRETWPHAKAGFFGVKKKIEPILGELGVPAG